MKPLKQCPVCQSKLKRRNYNKAWWEESCEDSSSHYHQYYNLSFEDEELKYINFYTKTFFVYTYFSGVYPTVENYIGLSMVYYRIFPRGQSTQQPCLKIRDLEIDLNNLDKLEQKLKTLLTFS